MKYDVIIVGGGMAGYSAALKCLEHGLKTAVISSGQSALHFSSGSVDVLSHSPITHEPVEFPFESIETLKDTLPDHPYAKLGVTQVETAMAWYQAAMKKIGLPFTRLPSKANHYRITTMGTLKSTWLSQPYVQPIDFEFNNISDIKRIILVSLQGFRDFQPQITQNNLAKHPYFKNIEAKVHSIHMAGFRHIHRNSNEFRSIDISRILSREEQFQEFANQLTSIATPQDLVILPAIVGDNITLMDRLQAQTSLRFHEVPTLPPSLLGIRIEDAMAKAFIRRGGSLLKGDDVIGGDIIESEGHLKLNNLKTKKTGDLTLSAQHFILASGSFFSKGLIAYKNSVHEPVFNLDIVETDTRANWYQNAFFSQQPHRFLAFGVATNSHFNPSLNGKSITNLFCAGSILAGYNPIAHGCGSGVAISTAHYAVEKILANRKQKIQPEGISA